MTRFLSRKQAPTPTPELPPPDDGHELRMSLLEHLLELRDRVMWSMLALIIGAVIGFIFAGQALRFILEPYASLFPESDPGELIVLGPTGAILAYMRVALLIGGVIAVPTATYQLLRFVVPGLTRKERRYVLMAVPAVAVLFVAGVAFTWFILMPPAIRFLKDFQSGIFLARWEAGQYIGFVTSLLFWMGVAFQMPLFFFVLALLGVVRAGTLASQWRIAIVGVAVAAAFITPTVDPMNMFLVMGPLLALYVFSILLAWIGWRMMGRR